MSRERDEFIAVLTKALPDKPMAIVIDTAKLLMRHGRSYARIQEMECNGHPIQSSYNAPIELVNKLQAKHERYCEVQGQRYERLITAAAGKVGLAVVFNGDPRGATVKVVLPDGKSNSWGRDGWCVPNS